ncbi:MAG: hypothetical protein WBD67_03550 [Terracidiphilus sp.]
MSQTILFEWVVDIAGISLLMMVYELFWKSQRVDALRERLFALRDELFNIVAEGRVPFNHPAYTKLRLLINGTIRFAHKATLATLVTVALTSKDKENEGTTAFAAWKSSLETLTDEDRKRVEGIHERVFSAYTSHIFYGSPLLVLLGVLIGIAMVFRAMARSFTGQYRFSFTRDTLSKTRERATRKVIEEATKSAPDGLEGALIDEGLRASGRRPPAFV